MVGWCWLELILSLKLILTWSQNSYAFYSKIFTVKCIVQLNLKNASQMLWPKAMTFIALELDSEKEKKNVDFPRCS